VRFRLHTPPGTTPEGKFLIEPYYGVRPEMEPNDEIPQATTAYQPAILAGTISEPGDEDYFKISVEAGQELVFADGGWLLGSALDPEISILREDHSAVLDAYDDYGDDQGVFSHRFAEAGDYYIRVADYQRSGSKNHFYRLKAGRFPVVTEVYPLGLRRGECAEVGIRGHGLDRGTVVVEGKPSWRDPYAAVVRPETGLGRGFRDVKLALGEYPELFSNEGNTSLEEAQTIAVPSTVNGRLTRDEEGQGVSHYYRFEAQKGKKLVLAVAAERLGSELDSMIEILDAEGEIVERATLRAVAQTYVTLSEVNPTRAGMRLHDWRDFRVGDYTMVGREINRIYRLPHGPDEDVLFEPYPPNPNYTLNFAARGAQRLTFFDTSPEAHAIDTPVYKVTVHPPGTEFTSNGLPLVRLGYVNDDGGPGFGKDSKLHFDPPADGEYFVRIQDVEGRGGRRFAYRLRISEPKRDFTLSVTPRNPNIPQGGHIPLSVTAFRADGFNAPIRISVEDLPEGVTANESLIREGYYTTTVLLSAAPDAKLDEPAPVKVKGVAMSGSQEIVRRADYGERLNLLSVTPPADIELVAHTREVVVEPGGEAKIEVSVKRRKGFGGRVPVEVYNMPADMDITAFGLNGILIPEDEGSRTIRVRAFPDAEPAGQWLYVAGKVETRAFRQQNVFAGERIKLIIRPRKHTDASAGTGEPD